jgi:hypothetical protein
MILSTITRRAGGRRRSLSCEATPLLAIHGFPSAGTAPDPIVASSSSVRCRHLAILPSRTAAILMRRTRFPHS